MSFQFKQKLLTQDVFHNFCLLTLAIAMIGFSMGIILPLSALKLTSFGLDSFEVGLLIAAHAFGLFSAILISEKSVKKYNSKKTIQIFSMVCSIFAFGMNYTDTTVLFGLMLFGFGLSIGVLFNVVEA